jgi:hypothetical protein
VLNTVEAPGFSPGDKPSFQNCHSERSEESAFAIDQRPSTIDSPTIDSSELTKFTGRF